MAWATPGRVLLECEVDAKEIGWGPEPVGLVERPVTRARVIAVEGAVNDWAAYCGPVTQSTSYLVAYGEKLPKAVAVRLFPLLNPARYRR
jgi:hypothetical protein